MPEILWRSVFCSFAPCPPLCSNKHVSSAPARVLCAGNELLLSPLRHFRACGFHLKAQVLCLPGWRSLGPFHRGEECAFASDGALEPSRQPSDANLGRVT